ncbi:MAG TPA: hypothetical protein VJ547_02730 [Candidatus Thermoplasmatota archaeon]|nr:hypothetical protein [Candidatus Thermoplasmatota archaeon]
MSVPVSMSFLAPPAGPKDPTPPSPDAPKPPGRLSPRSRKLLAVAVVSTLVAVGIWALIPDPTPAWDGGRWGPDTVLDTGGREFWAPLVAEFQGMLYLVNPVLSSGNFTEHGIEPGARYDVLFRTFDGTRLTPSRNVSDFMDQSSEAASGILVFDERLFVVTTRLSPDATGWTSSSIELYSFNGASWTQHPPVRALTPGSGAPAYAALVEFEGQLWAAWQEPEDTGNGAFHARAFSNGIWADPVPVALAGVQPQALHFLARPDGIWVSWFSNGTIAAANQGIYLGRFNGSAVDLDSRLSSGDTPAQQPHSLSAFGPSIAVFWQAGRDILSTFVTDGVSSAPLRVTKGHWPSTVVYKDRLYLTLVVGIAFPSGMTEWAVQAFDGTQWGPPFVWKTSRYTFELPGPFTFQGKLYEHWIDGSPGAWVAHLRAYER